MFPEFPLSWQPLVFGKKLSTIKYNIYAEAIL